MSDVVEEVQSAPVPQMGIDALAASLKNANVCKSGTNAHLTGTGTNWECNTEYFDAAVREPDSQTVELIFSMGLNTPSVKRLDWLPIYPSPPNLPQYIAFRLGRIVMPLVVPPFQIAQPVLDSAPMTLHKYWRIEFRVLPLNRCR
ncbi:hypothetical protein [Paraburkholderia hospita]|jgi:hypothetical protein|uniref:hypothetical protein n=1 Tax=Paraburkholderia hospita TaxID=169430 RepID=UPI000271822D|nr:hypothetical protein [Paraburkholderia hospita]EUC18391.1 hypothetical protein PMI06_003356 [Burkholderia sp. BT03]SKC77037.1 hypothetical protein SAMN06266956_3008 [Paraburkholderia hospita]